MAVTITSSRGPRAATVTPVDFSTILTPPSGGGEQKIVRPGSRFQIALDYPPMKGEDALQMQALLLRAKFDEAIVEVPQPGLSSRVYGTPRVNGANQTGKTLVTDGWVAGATVQPGQYFSIFTGGRYYLHMVVEPNTASGGAMTLAIEPMLRVQPEDNALLEFSAPKIQGFIADEGLGFSVGVGQLYGFSLSVRERQ